MAYVDISELQRVLRIDAPSVAQLDGMQRMIDAAAQEIDWELGYTAEAPAPVPPPPLVVEVNLERAEEHWKQSFTQFGVIPQGPDSVPVMFARDSWYRHRLKLAPLKTSWGVG